MMALPNLIALLLLSPVVFRLTRELLENQRKVGSDAAVGITHYETYNTGAPTPLWRGARGPIIVRYNTLLPADNGYRQPDGHLPDWQITAGCSTDNGGEGMS